MTGELGVTGARILIVEDDALLALNLKGHLEHAGFSVVGPAASASMALALLLKQGAMRSSCMCTLAGDKPRSASRCIFARAARHS